MHGHVAHFAFNADDLAASRRFDDTLLGWAFANPIRGSCLGFVTDPAGNLLGLMRFDRG